MKYMINETTQEERRKIVDDAIALSSLDSAQPTDFTKDLYEKIYQRRAGIKLNQKHRSIQI